MQIDIRKHCVHEFRSRRLKLIPDNHKIIILSAAQLIESDAAAIPISIINFYLKKIFYYKK